MYIDIKHIKAYNRKPIRNSKLEVDIESNTGMILMPLLMIRIILLLVLLLMLRLLLSLIKVLITVIIVTTNLFWSICSFDFNLLFKLECQAEQA